MNKENLVKYLEKEISEIKLDNYNFSTREWSKGFLKGSLFLLQKIKEWEDK